MGEAYSPICFLKKPGDRIDKGEVIAEIVNPLKTDMENRITPALVNC